MPTSGYGQTLINFIRECPLCPWKDKKHQTVPPQGPEDAEIAIIGRNPGTDEDKEGSPFVGRGGKFLNKFLYHAEIDRRKVWVTNLAKCFGGRGDPKPTPEVFLTCRPWLVAELCLIRPKLIISLGNDALNYITGWEASSLKLEGQDYYFEKTDTRLFVVSHPGYWCRQQTYFRETTLKTTVPKLKTLIEKLGITSAKLTEPNLYDLQETEEPPLTNEGYE